MSLRSHRLSRLILVRMSALEASLLEDGAGEAHGMKRRQDLVFRILLAEVGDADFVTSNLVIAALPKVAPGEEPTTREIDDFSAFLADQLGL